MLLLLQEAVDSAEKWKQFAEGLQAKGEELQAALGTLRQELEVRRLGGRIGGWRASLLSLTQMRRRNGNSYEHGAALKCGS